VRFPDGGPSPGDVWSGSGFFGTNTQLRGYAAPDRAASLDTVARSMAAAGVSWTRTVFDQGWEQRTQGETDWSIPDRIVGTLARHGLRTLALFSGTARWATSFPAALRCGDMAYPADVSAWSRFVGAAVRRYGRDGSFWAEHPRIPTLPIGTWEIGNEENLRMFWCPESNPEQYAQVYRASRAAAHAADGRARLIVGGLAPTFADADAEPGDVTVSSFLQRMIAADPVLADRIPAVGVHLYGPTVAAMLQELRLYRQAMVAAGLPRTPMLVNEAGWHTMGPHDRRYAAPASRAAMIRAITAASHETNCNVVGFGIHSWVTAQTDPNDPEDWYGLADPVTGVPDAGGQAYAAAIAAAAGKPGSAARPALSHLCG
jgi:hypothetical protein